MIRHLYKRYHDVKALLVGMESAAGSSVSTPLVSSAPAGTAPSGIPQTYGTVCFIIAATLIFYDAWWFDCSVEEADTQQQGELSESLKALQKEKRVLQVCVRV